MIHRFEEKNLFNIMGQFFDFQEKMPKNQPMRNPFF